MWASPGLRGWRVRGEDSDGRETLSYIEGEFTQPGPWSLEGATAVGTLLRQLDEATASYTAAPDAIWGPWFGRALGGPARVIGHCDFAPWNIVARNGLPVGLIDWDFAGPVDPLVELAQACWLNAKLHDEVLAEIEGLPPIADRARQLRAIVDAYGLSARQRRGFIDRIIESWFATRMRLRSASAIPTSFRMQRGRSRGRPSSAPRSSVVFGAAG